MTGPGVGNLPESSPRATARGPQRVAVGVAVAFLAAHLAFLPPSIDDIDSANFALGLRSFDVARHQPHPPGYPVFIAAGRIVHLVVRDEIAALSVLSAICGAFGLLALAALFARLEPERPRRWAVLAALAVVASPLYYVTSARPLSDIAGLSAAVAIQAITLAPGGLVLASVLTGLAIGIRSQVAWLTVPLLAFALFRRYTSARGLYPDQGPGTENQEPRTLGLCAAGLLAGVAMWAIPLVALTGGPARYWRVLFSQGAEDFTGVQMLWTNPTPRQAVAVLYYAFVAPWAAWPLATGILVCAVIGLVVMVRRARPALALMAAAFGPYLVFDLVFQESFTSRYALPIVVPVAYLAVRGVSALPRGAGIWIGAATVGLAATIGAISTASYTSMPAPGFRLLGDMQTAAASAHHESPVLAMHRREDLDFRRSIEWIGAGMPVFSRRLAAPPKHEWLELVKYWNGGGRAPVWFVADPKRTDLALVEDSGRSVEYRWPLNYPVLLGGVRPDEMDWHIYDSPGWYLGEGWSLTPEAAGVAEEDHRGPGLKPIEAWIRRRQEAVTLMVGGRNLASSGDPAHVTVRVEGRIVDEIAAAPGFFLKFVSLPAGTLEKADGYALLSIAADRPRVAVEQFDAQSEGRIVLGFGDGWHEREYNPATGRSWRWASDHGTIRLRARGQNVTLTMQGETETFSRQTRVTVRIGDHALAQPVVDKQFTVQVPIPAELLTSDETPVIVDSDQFWVPAERSRRTQDRRRLSLRVYRLQVRTASGPNRAASSPKGN